jgi:hypothetical protein
LRSMSVVSMASDSACLTVIFRNNPYYILIFPYKSKLILVFLVRPFSGRSDRLLLVFVCIFLYFSILVRFLSLHAAGMRNNPFECCIFPDGYGFF